MMNKQFLSLSFLALIASVDAFAQADDKALSQGESVLNGQGEYLFDQAKMLWHHTNNAASLTVDSTRNHGFAQLGADRTEGSFHRVQEGSSTNSMSFFTERFQHIGKYLYGYGSFAFDKGRTKDRKWSDVMRTYESNPFISGSSVAGKYDFQDFSLTGKIGTIDFNGWRFGAALDYNVADLSRLRDPRTRSRLLQYRITPSVSYTAGCGHTIGLSGWYDRRKEKMPVPTTVQNNPDLYYYQMSGLDAVTGTVGGYSGFSRQYVCHSFGGEVAYGFSSEGFSTVNTASLQRSTDNIQEQYKREPGRYHSYHYAFASQNRIKGTDIIHEIDLAAQYEQAYADEFRPQLVITIDSVSGYKSYHYENLMTYKKRYQMKKMELSLSYRADFTRQDAVTHYAGVSAKLSSLDQKHLLPLSTFKLSTLVIGAEYGQSVLRNRRLWVDAAASYLISTKADMALADETSLYSQQVLLKDMEYYRANCFRGSLALRYQFPLTVKKMRSLWYVKAYAETIQGQHSLSGKSFGLSIGVFN